MMLTLRKEAGIMSPNVDDLLYGSLPEAENMMKDILETFAVREHNEGDFRFCGKEVKQHDDFSITVTAKDNTEKIRPIDINPKRKLTDKRNQEETTCLRSVVAACCCTSLHIGLLLNCLRVFAMLSLHMM